MAGILRVDLAISSQGSGSICGAKRELLEDLLLQRAALIDRKQIAIFAIGKDDSIRINHWSVDAPLEAERMIRYARYGAVRISPAALSVGVLEAPLDIHQTVRAGRAELSHKVLFRGTRRSGVTICGAQGGIGTIDIRRESVVMVILGDDRVRPIMRVDCSSDVPSEIEVGQELPR